MANSIKIKEDLTAPDLKAITLAGENAVFMDNTVLNKGNQARIARIFKKAQNGDNITVVTIGGSITSGAWATSEENKYASRVANWFKEKFPNITVNFHNAGISATPSIIGVHRVKEQVLAYDPDFVVVDFTTNDTANDPMFRVPYENLVRRILEHSSTPAVLGIAFGSSSNNRRNENSLSSHLPTVLHYDIPFIDYFGNLWTYIDAGVFEWSDIAADTIHPNDNGHKIVAECINRYLDKVLEDLDNIDTEIPELPKDFFFGSDAFMRATFLKSDNYIPTVNNGFVSASLHADKGDRIMGWSCGEDGGTLTFEVGNTTSVSVFVQKTAGNGTADIYINGKLILENVDGSAASDKVIRHCHTEFFKSAMDATVTVVAHGKFGVGPLGITPQK